MLFEIEHISQKYLQVQDDHSLSRSDPGTLKLSLPLTIKWQRFICNLVQCLSKSLCNQGVVWFFFLPRPVSLKWLIFCMGPGGWHRQQAQGCMKWWFILGISLLPNRSFSPFLTKRRSSGSATLCYSSGYSEAFFLAFSYFIQLLCQIFCKGSTL